MSTSNVIYLTPHERSSLNELPSACEALYGDYPPRLPQLPLRAHDWNWWLILGFAASLAIWGLVIWALISVFQ